MLSDSLLHLGQDRFWDKEGSILCGVDPYCQSSVSRKITLEESSWFMFSWTVAKAGKVTIGYERKYILSPFFRPLKHRTGLEVDASNRNH